jgi:hypothetical protein
MIVIKQISQTLNSLISSENFVVNIGIRAAVILVTPLVSLVAVPVFAALALYHWNQHRSLYNQTLTDGKRAKFGRIEGQNYTHWNGTDRRKPDEPENPYNIEDLKDIENQNFQEECLHKIQKKEKYITYIKENCIYEIRKLHDRAMELRMSRFQFSTYSHDKENRTFLNDVSQYPQDCPFQTKEDSNWLEKEFSRREKEEFLKSDLKFLRIFARAIFPVGGIMANRIAEKFDKDSLLVKLQLVGAKGDIKQDLGWDWQETEYWNWKEAINFHQHVLLRKISTYESLSARISALERANTFRLNYPWINRLTDLTDQKIGRLVNLFR